MITQRHNLNNYEVYLSTRIWTDSLGIDVTFDWIYVYTFDADELTEFLTLLRPNYSNLSMANELRGHSLFSFSFDTHMSLKNQQLDTIMFLLVQYVVKLLNLRPNWSRSSPGLNLFSVIFHFCLSFVPILHSKMRANLFD